MTKNYAAALPASEPSPHASLLEFYRVGCLEAEVILEVRRDLADEPLEGELPQEQVGRLLVREANVK